MKGIWPYEAKTQKEFLIASYEYYEFKWGNVSGLGVGHHIVEWLYKLGRDYCVLNMDYDEFHRNMVGSPPKYYYDPWRCKVRYIRRYWCNRYRNMDDYRVSRSFVKNNSKLRKKKKKKDMSWWIESGLIKDRRRSSGDGFHWYCKKNVKFFSSRKHRRFERQMIHHEQYDELHGSTHKYIEDVWSWD